MPKKTTAKKTTETTKITKMITKTKRAIQLIGHEVDVLFHALQDLFTTSDNVEMSVYHEMVTDMAKKLNENLLTMYNVPKEISEKEEEVEDVEEDVEKKEKPKKKTPKKKMESEVVNDDAKDEVKEEVKEEKKEKPLNPYMKFCKEQREKQKGLTAKTLGEMWKALSPDEQKTYKSV